MRENKLINQRILTSNGHTGTIINFNDFREPDLQVAIQMDDGETYKDLVFISFELAVAMVERFNKENNIPVNEIREELIKYKRVLEDKGFVVLYIGLYGSQNYNLHDEESDIDVKAIVLPTLHDIVFRNNVSTTIECENGNIDVKDLVTFYEVIKKGNFSYIESIDTNYWLGSNEVKKLFLQFRPNLKSIVGAMHDKRNALDHPYPSKAEEFAKWGCDPKQYHHIVRLFDLLIHNLSNEEQLSYIDYNDKSKGTEHSKKTMIEIKRNTLGLNKIEMLSDSDDYINRARDLVDYKNYIYESPDLEIEIYALIERYLRNFLSSDVQVNIKHSD